MSRKDVSHRLRQIVSRSGESVILRPEVLLCANIPKPLHELAPREILGREWWDRTRREAYQSTKYRCIACGVMASMAKYHPWLEGHEIYQIDYKRGIAVYKETVPLCHACHSFIHDGRMLALVQAGKMTLKRYDDIMKHGNAILKKHNLVKFVYTGPIAPWEKWRLSLEGKLYSPKFASYEAWKRHFHPKRK